MNEDLNYNDDLIKFLCSRRTAVLRFGNNFYARKTSYLRKFCGITLDLVEAKFLL